MSGAQRLAGAQRWGLARGSKGQRVIRAVFFDLDDTLCNSAAAFAAGRRAAFDEALSVAPWLTREALEDGWARAHAELMPALVSGELTMAAVRDMRFRRALAAAGAPDDALADRLDALLGETQLAHLRRFDDVAALAALRRRGVFVGVITNGADDERADSQRTKAARLGLFGELDGFWVSDSMGYRKPDPRAFAPALAAAGGEAAECVYVGDSLADIAGAHAAGLRGALILRDESEPLERAEPRPWRIVRSLWQTLDLLDDD